MKKIYSTLPLSLSLFLLLTACGNATVTPSAATPTPSAGTVIAEAHLVPNQGLFLSFLTSGRVDEVLVHTGDQVTQGQILVRLGDRQQVQTAVAGAQAQLVASQQTYDLLLRTANLAHAQAWQTYMNSQKTRAAAQLAWDKLNLNTLQVDINNAVAEVASRKTDLENAQKDFDKYSSLPAENASRKTSEDKLRTAQINYDTAVQKADDLANRRDMLQAALNATLAAETEARRAFDNTQNGPDIDKLALVSAQLDAAKTQASAAQAALDNYDLKAPFAGVVAEVNASVSQMVGPQAWAVALVDDSQWYLDTSDLTEMDAVKVNIGQSVKVTADALPGITMTGEVESISAAPKFQGGDVLYTVHIRLKDPAPGLLWGMTMEVTFSK
jgi:multidrug efflux pump subunit AcrA (membrane-fusion protein)